MYPILWSCHAGIRHHIRAKAWGGSARAWQLLAWQSRRHFAEFDVWDVRLTLTLHCAVRCGDVRCLFVMCVWFFKVSFLFFRPAKYVEIFCQFSMLSVSWSRRYNDWVWNQSIGSFLFFVCKIWDDFEKNWIYLWSLPTIWSPYSWCKYWNIVRN